jgi:hypothetical protein
VRILTKNREPSFNIPHALRNSKGWFLQEWELIIRSGVERKQEKANFASRKVRLFKHGYEFSLFKLLT